MIVNRQLLNEALSLVIETHAETRRRTQAELVAAYRELQLYLPKLIAAGTVDRTRLAVQGLIHLKELERASVAVIAVRSRRSSRAKL